MNARLHAVVMAGGSGTRFWPKSRRNRPKQLLRLYGATTMLQQTLDRVAPLTAPERTWIVTGIDQAEATRAQTPDLAPSQILAEPCPRDTAACVGLAARRIVQLDPEALMLVMPADHVIEPAEEFRRAARAAVALIAEDPRRLVTFGVPPTRPETGYGYMETGEEIGRPEGLAARRALTFREKPDRATAETFLASGRFVWNAGIFGWKAATILEEIARHQPDLAAGLDRLASDLGTDRQSHTLAEIFPTLPKLPIDKAVMERSQQVVVLETPYRWSDVGDWRALAGLGGLDDQGNVLQGPTHVVNTRDSVIIADEGNLVAVLGLSEVVVVQSGGATLVARKDALDNLKALVEELPKAGFPHVL